ncbi:hypothetical protein ACHMXB_11915 [Arthrobacter sp. UC242_113]|uniref:hypothetical protein n=1 Tax=Arthrobacter sp. UC242_113 TaxID=3374550 RepID=UPI00375741C8
MIRATRNRNRALVSVVSLAVASLLLSGCAAAAGSTGRAGTASAPPPPSSRAATHSGDQHAQTQSSGPSEASKMVCGQETKDDISSILALEQAPHAVDEWADSTYTCTYHLADGLLVISVKESPAPAAARKYFDALQGKLEAAPIKGLANLGFPAAQTPDGSVVFLKDSSTLHVNATGLPPAVGPQKVAPTDFAYQVATTILACWKEHH